MSLPATRPAFIRQPGPPAQERAVVVEGRGRPLTLSLAAGLPLVEAVSRAFAIHGFTGGTVDVSGLSLAPFAYVMPALSTTPDHAAFYSERFEPDGITRLEAGAMTFGRRDGAPFFHCHALWQEADGRRNGGHILPDGTVLAADAQVQAFGFAGGIFEANPDPETGFKLFGPVVDPAAGGEGTRAFAVRLRPNQDFAGALEAFCRARGLASARIHGGVGSTIGAAFVGGPTIVPFATEVFLTGATVRDGTGGLVADLPAGLVDYTGGLAGGRLARGDNPVLMTFELILEAREP